MKSHVAYPYLLGSLLRCLGPVAVVLLLVTGCTGPERKVASASVVEALSRGQGEFARVTTPRPFVFPRDHGPHPEYRTEWWYYTGNLTDGDGHPYGFQLTFFRSGLTAEMPARQSDLATNQLYMAQFAVTSGPADRHLSFERFSRGAGGLAGAVGEPEFGVWLEDWTVRQTGAGVYELVARAEHKDGPVALRLTLHETRPPVLHGDNGLSPRGPEPGNANYYYSLVQLETSGEVTFEGKSSAVSGVSWMDHEFGTISLSGDTTGWDWFAVQLNNGMALMFGELHDRQGSARSLYGGTLSYPDGRQVKLEEADFDLAALGQWTSPESGIVYPAGWRVTFPRYHIDLTIQPLIADQEMEVSFVYYEGATTVQAQVDGEEVDGVGYVELTGYGNNTGGYQR